MRRALRTVLHCLLIAGFALSQHLPSASAADAPASPEPLYLQLYINGHNRELVVQVNRIGDTLYMAPSELSESGILIYDLPAGTPLGVSLKEVSGLEYTYRADEQSLDLRVADFRLVPQMLGTPSTPEVEPTSDTGLRFDYALHLQKEEVAYNVQANSRRHVPTRTIGYGAMPVVRQGHAQRAYEESNRQVSLGSGVRLFSDVGLFVNNGHSWVNSDESEYVRDDSYWTYSTIDPLRSYTVGDFISSSLPWTRSLRMGGVRLQRNFDVRPDLITFPVPALGGSAVVPTTVDLYINGIRQFSGASGPGPFLFSEPPALTGAGRASIVYEDALGRRVTTTRSLYMDNRLLARGLSDYGIEVGYARRDYGWESFEYAPTPAGTGSIRYGLNDVVTLEGHGEGADGLANAGVGLLWNTGRFGVIDGAVAASDGDGGSGTMASIGYRYVAPRWSIDLRDQRTQHDFRDLGSLEDVPVPPRMSYASMTFSVTPTTSLNAYYADVASTFTARSRIVSLGMNASWFQSRINAVINVFDDLERDDALGGYIGISMSVGERSSVYTGYSQTAEQWTGTVSANKPVDYDLGGIGWNVIADVGNDDYLRLIGQLDYRNDYGDWTMMLERGRLPDSDYSNSSLYGEGSLLVMNGQFFAARPIYDGFALVSTDGIPDVPVLRENRLLGTTNRRGYLLIPDLPSYRVSQLAVDPTTLPVDVAAGSYKMLANPREQSGVLVQFAFERYRGATVVLVDEVGTVIPPGTRVVLPDGTEAVSGYDGQVFFQQLQPSNTVRAFLANGECEADVPFSAEQTMKVIGPFTCRRVQ